MHLVANGQEFAGIKGAGSAGELFISCIPVIGDSVALLLMPCGRRGPPHPSRNNNVASYRHAPCVFATHQSHVDDAVTAAYGRLPLPRGTIVGVNGVAAGSTIRPTHVAVGSSTGCIH